jgi:pyruvate ferredoxin oxidoreductase alpha subunit
MFRPFPTEAFKLAVRGASKLAVLDRNCSAGTGGIFWQEIRAVLQGEADVLIQNYLTGVSGLDVTPQQISEIIADLQIRTSMTPPVWKGITV